MHTRKFVGLYADSFDPDYKKYSSCYLLELLQRVDSLVIS